MEETLELTSVEAGNDNSEVVSESEIEKLNEYMDLLWKINEGNLLRYNYSDQELRSVRKKLEAAFEQYFFIITKHCDEPENTFEQKNFIYREPTMERAEQWERESEQRDKGKEYKLKTKNLIIELCNRWKESRFCMLNVCLFRFQWISTLSYHQK